MEAKGRSTKSHEIIRSKAIFRVVSGDFVDRFYLGITIAVPGYTSYPHSPPN